MTFITGILLVVGITRNTNSRMSTGLSSGKGRHIQRVITGKLFMAWVPPSR
jgi:hypothetical protein